MGQVIIECEAGKVSDGYHTFDELYEHRCLLFCMLLEIASAQDCIPMGWDLEAWKAKNHADGSSLEGWFVAGISLQGKMITYHLPLRMWDLLVDVETLDRAPEWDGHTSSDVLHRVHDWLGRIGGHLEFSLKTG